MVDSAGGAVDKVQSVLRVVFKHQRFKSTIQQDAIRTVVKGKQDVFISMPTGSGKSLCFQLPAVLNEKVTVVFSPLLALMKDQLDYLQNLKIEAKTINSKITAEERRAVLADLNSDKPTIRLLYITPEQAQTQTFKDLIQKLHKSSKLANFVVDEAHCVSQWGHDFRPDYLKLGKLRKLCPGVQWVAVTATANKLVQEDIYKQLHLKSPVAAFKVSCFRSNLFYDIVFVEDDDTIDDLIEFMQGSTVTDGLEVYSVEYDSGIIYCRTRKQTEELVYKLQQKGVPAMAYHAGLRDKERFGIQDDWMQEKCKIIAATVSFGMGVDKSNVRFVAHWGLPQNVAGYYQESGRAGRDGQPARCRIYYSRKEKDAVTFLLNKAHSSAKDSKKAKAKAAIASFQCMIKYCEETKCRHSVFTDYFGDDTPECVDKCDCCIDAKAVQKKIDRFQIMSARKCTSIRMNNLDDSDLYGGGRAGQKKETEEYDRSGEKSNERTAQHASNSLIQKQFALRKAAPHISAHDAEIVRNSRVRSAETTTRKVNGLTVNSRESYLSLAEDALKKNWEKCKLADEFMTVMSDSELTKCAVQVEYEAFSSNKVASLYKRLLLKIVGDVKKNTEEGNLDPRIKFWKEGKLYNGVVSCSMSESGIPSKATNTVNVPPLEIKTASQVLAEQSKGIVPASKMLPPQQEKTKAPKAPKVETKKSTTTPKVDKQQTSITSFFTQGAIKKEQTAPPPPSVKGVIDPRRAAKDKCVGVKEFNEWSKPLPKMPPPPENKLKRRSGAGRVDQAKKQRPLKEKKESKRVSLSQQNKSAVAEKTIKLLNPHYKTGKIKSKEAFKKIARTISHYLTENSIKDDDLIQSTVLSYLEQKTVFASESDVFEI